MFKPFLSQSASTSPESRKGTDSRISKDVDRNLPAALVFGFLDPKRPEQTSYTDECTLLGEALSAANSSTPAKGHVAFVVGKGSGIGTVLYESLWVEAVGFRKFTLVVVDSPSD